MNTTHLIKRIPPLLFLVFTLISCSKSEYKDASLKAANDLIERVTPGYSSQFKLELITDPEGKDIFEIDTDDSFVVLRGNNPISIATAFNWYLKYYCNAHTSWFGDRLNLPDQLPLPSEKVYKEINGEYRAYFNYCTLSYTGAWWDWERWQKEIDYMAMNSINMPLSVIGLEAVWYNTLLRFNFTDQEAREFLVAQHILLGNGCKISKRWEGHFPCHG